MMVSSPKFVSVLTLALNIDTDAAEKIQQAIVAEIQSEVDEATDGSDMDDKIESAVDKALENRDFSDEVEDSVSKAVEAAINDGDLNDSIESAVSDYIEGMDDSEARRIGEKVAEGMVETIQDASSHALARLAEFETKARASASVLDGIAARGFFGRLSWLFTGR